MRPNGAFANRWLFTLPDYMSIERHHNGIPEKPRKNQTNKKKQKFQQLRGALRRGWEGEGCVVIGRHHNGITEKPRKNKKKQNIQRKCLKIDEKP